MRLSSLPVRAMRGAAIVGLMPAIAASARAQTADVSIRAARRDTVAVESGATMTAVFAVANASAHDTARFGARLEVPRDWRAVTGVVPFALVPGAGDTWLAGVSVPAGVPAGIYVVRGVAGAVSDSIVVRVEMRRGLDVVALDAPDWVMAGSALVARFLVRNTGNVSATVMLTASAGRTIRVGVDRSTLDLPPAGSAIVTVRSDAPPGMTRTADDVIQLDAVDQAVPDERVRASARTTLVPRSEGGGDYATMPAAIAIRSTGASGVSPLLLSGSGFLADGRTKVDFRLQAPTDQRSPFGFGERDEYRVALARDGMRLRAGDNVYGSSVLTSSGIMGTGAEFRTTRGALQGGAYVQNYRWTPGSPTEESVWVTAAADSLTRATATATLRQSGAGAIGVVGLGGSVRTPLGGLAEVEAAVSDSAGAAGAWRARLAGDTLGVRYDASVLHGADTFAGAARGTTVAAAALGTQLPFGLDIAGNVSRRDWSYAVSSIGRMGQAFSTATMSLTWRGATAIEYGWLARRDEGAFEPVNGSQRGVRISSAAHLVGMDVSGSVERGAMRANPGAPLQAYTLFSGSVRTALGRYGSIGLSGSRSVGHTLTGASNDILGAGANAQLHLPNAVEAGLTFNAQRATFGMLDTSGAWFSIVDARVERRLFNGATIGLHLRSLRNPAALGAGNSNAVYLEYRMPFRLPTGPSHEAGRAIGRVMDADRGQPVAGVLVRLGDQAAVSDRNGYVRFAGLDQRLQRVTIDPAGAAAGAILTGDVQVDMRQATAEPVDFAVAVTRGAQVVAHVVRRDPEIAESADGPSYASGRGVAPMGGVLVALQGARDTLYQASDSRGNVLFGTVAPGRWTLAVQGGAEPRTRFEHERIDVSVVAGDRRDVQFILVPVERQVKMMDGGGELRARRLPDGPGRPGVQP